MSDIKRNIESILVLLLLASIIFSVAAIISVRAEMDAMLRVKNKISMSCISPETSKIEHVPYKGSAQTTDSPKEHNGKDRDGSSCPQQAGGCHATVLCDREIRKVKKPPQ